MIYTHIAPSLVINLDQIVSIDFKSKYVYMVNGTRLAVDEKYWSKFKTEIDSHIVELPESYYVND